MDAESREAVFTALRVRGIKAIKVVAADGSKANGEVRGVRRRVVAALVALVALGVGVVAYISGTRTGAAVAANPANAAPRHQIYGDPAIMERFERGDFEGVLPREGDRLLAWLAVPGRVMCPKDADPRQLNAERHAQLSAYAADELDVSRDLPIQSEEPREVRELKQIVNGIREEMREYLANGNGTPKSFWRRMVQRTMQEMQIYERTKRELEKEKDSAVWEAKNEQLRRIGLRTITNAQEE